MQEKNPIRVLYYNNRKNSVALQHGDFDMKALAYAFSAENPHALRNILLVAVTIAYLVVIVVLFLRLRHANQKMADRMKELNNQKQAGQTA